ncbi:hypothetical protein F2P79_013618 [Pimephales promelas]|nr:hypothetical protein F2P79_013618 [Pimephales promelas]
MILYFILSIVMFLAIIGVLQIKLQVCKKTHQQYQDEELEQLYSTNDEEVKHIYNSTIFINEKLNST